MIKSKKIVLLIFILFLCLFINTNYSQAWFSKGVPTEENYQKQIDRDDAILAKNPEDLTWSEKRRLKKIRKSQEIKRSKYEKRAKKHLKNNQPKTYTDYEKLSIEVKNSDLQDFNPIFTKDPRLEHVPEPEFKVIKYNYPPGTREINLSILKTNRNVKSQGVLSPDNKIIVYTDTNYDTGMRKASSSVYVIPVVDNAFKQERRLKFLDAKEQKLTQLKEEFEQTKKELDRETKKLKKEEIKTLKKEVEELKKAFAQQEINDENAEKSDTPSQKAGKLLIQSHIKDKILEPIMSTGMYDTNYGVSRILTVVDWASNSKIILLKERIGQDGSGIWQTNIWVCNLITGESKKLDEVRQAIEYYWLKTKKIDLHYTRYDIYPLGWEVEHPDRIVLYAYGYTNKKGTSPKFLGTWSIDYKGEQSRLLSLTKMDYPIQANGYCLKAKYLEYYEK